MEQGTVAALIIASGKTSRRDGFEPQKEVGSITAIERIVKTFRRAGCGRIVIVSGEGKDSASALAARMNAIFLHSSKAAEMFDNVRLGLDYLQDKCRVALITHVGIPLFSVETARKLMAAQGAVNIPCRSGKAGHPIAVRSECFGQIQAYDGDGGLAGAIKSSGLERVLVEVDDEGILTDIHYEKDFEKLLAGHSLAQLYPDVRIRLAREKAFYGPGAHQLLTLIDETSSLSEACRQMGISYSKGRSIIALIEQQSGHAVIEGCAGGKSGGYSVVTIEGKKLMRNYNSFCNEARQCIDAIFRKHFTGDEG